MSTQNYGDIALNLSAQWSRTQSATSPEFTIKIVGHDRGLADARLKNAPEKQHQFRWIDPRDQSGVSMARTKKYVYVTKTEWDKNEELWEWDGDGFIVHNGERLMARDGAYYLAEKEKAEEDKKATAGRRADSDEEERAMRRIEQRGGAIIAEDNRGRQLKPLSK